MTHRIFTGTMSTFGGPEDMGVSPSEGLALCEPHEMDVFPDTMLAQILGLLPLAYPYSQIMTLPQNPLRRRGRRPVKAGSENMKFLSVLFLVSSAYAADPTAINFTQTLTSAGGH